MLPSTDTDTEFARLGVRLLLLDVFAVLEGDDRGEDTEETWYTMMAPLSAVQAIVHPPVLGSSVGERRGGAFPVCIKVYILVW